MYIDHFLTLENIHTHYPSLHSFHSIQSSFTTSFSASDSLSHPLSLSLSPLGDNIHTASAIAKQCGILTPGGIALEGPVFRKMSPKELDAVRALPYCIVLTCDNYVFILLKLPPNYLIRSIPSYAFTYIFYNILFLSSSLFL